MREGSKLLFIGHAPPPARQWQSSKLSGGNATINHLSRFWRSEGFARVLRSNGLGPKPIETDVALDIVNIIPVISVATKPIGKKGGTCLNDYVGSEDRHSKNSNTIRHQVEKGEHDLIIVGWGYMTGPRAKLANDMLAYLRKESLDRTILYCAVKGLGGKGGVSYRYAGHPHGGFAKGDAALPLAQYATSIEAKPIGCMPMSMTT